MTNAASRRAGRLLPPDPADLPLREPPLHLVPDVRELFRLRHHRGHRPVAHRRAQREPGHGRGVQHDVQHRRHPGPPLRRRPHRPAGDAQGQHHLLGPRPRRRGHRLAGQVHPPDVPRPVHLRGRLRAAGRGPERHAGPLVQEQGAGAVLRRGPDREPPRLPLRPQQRRAHHEVFRQLPQRPPGRGRRVRRVARRQHLLYRHGQAGREGPQPPRRERRRQDRLQGHQGVQADLLVRHRALLHLLRGHLPLPEPVDRLLPHQVGDRPGGRGGAAASWPRSSTTSSTSSARPAASRASSSSPR